MKTPREILLGRHGDASPKLDTLRRKALAATQQPEPASPPFSLRNFLWSIRWHLAGMSALWLVIALFSLSSNHGSQMVATISPAKIPPPEVILASLRENHQRLSQMIDGQTTDADKQKGFAPKPRSERPSETLIA
jgi:hypothetical protein